MMPLLLGTFSKSRQIHGGWTNMQRPGEISLPALQALVVLAEKTPGRLLCAGVLWHVIPFMLNATMSMAVKGEPASLTSRNEDQGGGFVSQESRKVSLSLCCFFPS